MHLVKWKWHTAKYGDPYSEFILYIYPSKCTHTHSSEHMHSEHTLWTHTRSSGQPFILRRLWSSCMFGALLKGSSVVVLKVERALYIHSPPPTIPPDRDSNLQPFNLTHLDVVKTTCWSSNRASERGFKRLNVEWLLVSDGLVWVFHKLLIYWDFHTQPSLGFTENGLKKRNIQRAAVVWMKMSCWCQRSEENGQTG